MDSDAKCIQNAAENGRRTVRVPMLRRKWKTVFRLRRLQWIEGRDAPEAVKKETKSDLRANTPHAFVF